MMNMPEKRAKAMDWFVGILFLGSIVTLYVLYHGRNWSLLGTAVEALRSWWIFFRLAIGC